MNSSNLVILVEGNDDERFFKTLSNLFLNKFFSTNPIIWKYAEEKPEKRRKFIKSINSMNNYYLYISDINDTPCVTMKREKIKEILHEQFDENKIFIVKKKIEGWYLAGLDEKSSKKMKIKNFESTDEVTKQTFYSLIPSKYNKSYLNFKIEILNNFSLENAAKKNTSFKYFIEKFEKQMTGLFLT